MTQGTFFVYNFFWQIWTVASFDVNTGRYTVLQGGVRRGGGSQCARVRRDIQLHGLLLSWGAEASHPCVTTSSRPVATGRSQVSGVSCV